MWNKYHSLLSLTGDKHEWSICVRAQVIWKGINRQSNTFRGYNIIFIDDQSCRIHAFISDKISDGFEKDLKEGQIYNVSNFKVKIYESSDETTRAIRNEKHIYFDSQTKLVLLKDSVCNIQPFAFDLFGLQDVEQCLNNNRFLIDVIGIIDTTNPKCVAAKEDNQKSHMKFQITDGRYKVNITFFNEFGVLFEEAFKEVAGEEVVIIISSAKVNKYDGETYLTNYPATRFYLNPTHYSVKQLKKSMANIEIEEEIDNKLYTIDEIKKFKEEYKDKDVLCHVTVKKVEEDYNWYDIFCTGCGEEITKVDGRYRCNQKDCNRNIPYPDKRFRLCTVCSDQTGILAILFPDEEIQRITGKDAFDIENDDSQVGDGISFPPLLKQFEKKEYILTLTPSEQNINKSCKIYKAKKLGDPKEVLGNHDPFEKKTSQVEDLTMNIDSSSPGIVLSKLNSPPTGKSTNRMSGRKNKTPIKIEMEDDSPQPKLQKSKS